MNQLLKLTLKEENWRKRGKGMGASLLLFELLFIVHIFSITVSHMTYQIVSELYS